MTGGDGHSVTCWLGDLKEGDHAAAQPLWERISPGWSWWRGASCKRLRRTTAGEDEEDAALSAFNSFCAGAARGGFPSWPTATTSGGSWS